MLARLSLLADRLSGGANLNPTGLLVLRNTPLPASTRLSHRIGWLERVHQRREGSDSASILGLISTTWALCVARQSGLTGRYLVRNQQEATELSAQLRRLQPGWRRLSHYCSRQVASDVELLAVQRYAQALTHARIDGDADYCASLETLCRQADMRYRLQPSSAEAIRRLTVEWRCAIAQPRPPAHPLPPHPV